MTNVMRPSILDGIKDRARQVAKTCTYAAGSSVDIYVREKDLYAMAMPLTTSGSHALLCSRLRFTPSLWCRWDKLID